MTDYSYRKLKKPARDRKIPWKAIIPAASTLLAIMIVIMILVITRIHRTDQKYIAAGPSGLEYYTFDETEQRLIRASDTLPRGICVSETSQTYYENGISYQIIQYDGNSYYILPGNLTSDPDKIVTETTIWVRTSATVYSNADGFEISSYAPKGTALEVLGYDSLLEDGTVHKYNVAFTDDSGSDVSGWIYGKYISDDEEYASAVNEEYYNIHKDRAYSGRELYGGYAYNLEWDPVSKPSFEDNPICEYSSGMYISIKVLSEIDDYIDIAAANGVNLFVVDIKDEMLAYPCEEIKELSPTSYYSAFYESEEFYADVIQKCKDAGIYVVGRIVVFRDEYYSYDHEEDCISSSSSSQLWPSAFSRDVWYYNITLAETAVKKFGFNEIQFDYVRFPDESYNMSESGDTDFRNYYNEDKAEAIQNFCYYACDCIHELGAYVSVDVFGECVNKYVTAYGQYFPAISNVVDAISAMPYTDHFDRNTDSWTDPYPTVYEWALKAAARQSEIASPAVCRTWITAYDVPYWNVTKTCDAQYIADEAQALADAGLSGGFLTWNGASSISKYAEISSAFAKVYTKGIPRVTD